MPTKASNDVFANYASITCTETAPNTLTYKKLETGISTFDKLAWIINRIDYDLRGILVAQFNGDGDEEYVAITAGNSLTTLMSGKMQTDPTVIHGLTMGRSDLGAAATGMFNIMPKTFNFADLPGGGIIIPPTSIFLAVQGSGLVAAATVYCRIYYTIRELKAEDYWELVEARRVISA
jgi:hypothetical protein